MGLFGVVGTLLLGLVLSTAAVSDETRSAADITEESTPRHRADVPRAPAGRAVDAVQLNSLGAPTTAITIWQRDFNGDGVRDPRRLRPRGAHLPLGPGPTPTDTDRGRRRRHRGHPSGARRQGPGFDLQLRSSLWQSTPTRTGSPRGRSSTPPAHRSATTTASRTAPSSSHRPGQRHAHRLRGRRRPGLRDAGRPAQPRPELRSARTRSPRSEIASHRRPAPRELGRRRPTTGPR